MASTARDANVNKDIRELKDNIVELKRIVQKHASADKASDVIDMLHLKGFNGEIKKLAQNSGKTLRDVYRKSADAVIDTRDDYETRIKENPFKSTAAAFGIGAIVTLLLRR